MPGSEIDLLPEGDDEGKIFDYFEVVRRILDDNPDHYHILITGRSRVSTSSLICRITRITRTGSSCPDTTARSTTEPPILS